MEAGEENKYYISCLYDHIDETFRKGNGAIALKVSNLIEKGIVKGLQIDDVMFPMRGPYAKLEEKLIVLQAGFVSYLWTVCYFMIGLIEIYQDKAQTAKPVVSLTDSGKFELLNNTFAWGRSLKLGTADDFTPWPEHIANPTHSDMRSRQANHLLVLATSYLMYHELGHLVLHSDALDFISSVNAANYQPTAEDKRRLRTMEVQADIFALDNFFLADAGEHERYMKFMAAIIAQFSEFFLRDMPDTRSRNYPDLDERLKRVLDKIDIDEIGLKMNIELTFSIGLQLFLSLTFAEYLPSVNEDFAFEDFEGLKTYLFKIIDSWKERYNSVKISGNS